MILVTGGTGFVGLAAVRRLREAGRPVRCLVRSKTAADLARQLGCDVASGDVTDAQSVARATLGCDAVIHLVAIIQGRPDTFHRVMVQGTRNVVDAARTAGVRRFVLMSALGTGESTKDLVPYYAAKWAMEQMAKGSGLEYVILRPSFVFGPGGGALTQFASLVRNLPATPVVGPGTQRIQPVDVDDVAAAIIGAVDVPQAANRTFELGGPEVLDWNELWRRIASTMGKRRPLVHIPLGLMRLQATFLELLPKPPVTRDQLTMLAAGDNVCDPAEAVETFDLTLTPLDEQLRKGLAG